MYIPPKKTKNYFMPVKVYYGRDILEERLNKITSNDTSILIVCGEHFKTTAKFDQLKRAISFTLYTGKILKSNNKTIDELAKYLRKNKFDSVIAIGGGKIIDVVKSACILAEHDGLLEDYIKNKSRQLTHKGLQLIAVPTTSGTGSEVTPWATVWGDDKKKYSLTSEYMFPDYAIIDPSLTDDLSPSISATSGIDALCQAIESYWNINSNSVTRRYSLKAIELIINSISNAVHSPNVLVRDNMALGSLYSGLAFSNTQTTICHAVSYPITAHWNIQHGQAVALTMPSFLKLFLPKLSPRIEHDLLKALNVTAHNEAEELIKRLIKEIGLKTKLSELGIIKSGIDLIVKESFYTNRAANTPVVISAEQVKNMLTSIY